MIDLLHQFSDFFAHLPEHLETFARDHGAWVYLLLGGIVFCETGLVILPFLPGDSLLFACGMLAWRGELSTPVLALVFIGSALAGDNCNYWLGRVLGPKILRGERVRLLNRKNLERTRVFFARHGRKAVVFARFVPFVRTFAPFTAGVGLMPYGQFLAYSLFGAAAWVGVCMSAGWSLGRIPLIRDHFSLALVTIVLVSLIPVLIGAVRARREGQRRTTAAEGDSGGPPSVERDAA